MKTSVEIGELTERRERGASEEIPQADDDRVIPRETTVWPGLAVLGLRADQDQPIRDGVNQRVRERRRKLPFVQDLSRLEVPEPGPGGGRECKATVVRPKGHRSIIGEETLRHLDLTLQLAGLLVPDGDPPVDAEGRHETMVARENRFLDVISLPSQSPDTAALFQFVNGHARGVVIGRPMAHCQAPPSVENANAEIHCR